MADHSVKEFFNETADQYRSDLKAGSDITLSFVKEASTSGDCLLDIGCGSGAFMQAAQDRTAVSETIGIDIARNMLPPPEMPGDYGLGDAGSLPFADDSFDFVHVDTVLHHVVGPSRSASKDAVRDVLAEVERVLKPDGYVLIIERFQIARGIPDRALSQLIFWGLKFASPVVALSGSNPKVGQPPICFYTEDELLELTRNVGFALEDLARVREYEFLPLRRIIQKESQRVTLFLRNE